MKATSKVGVLALQGDSEPHRSMFRRLGVPARDVRSPADLDGLTHLVLPGGESTTLHHLMTLFGLWEPIAHRTQAGSLTLFGTCAGAILVGRAAENETRPPRMKLIDAVVRRNAYGRQLESHTRDHEIFGGIVPCTFIRAPRIEAVADSVRVLATDGETPILIEAPGVLAATFHPELSEDTRVHAHFLEREPVPVSSSLEMPHG
jgi:5'-phosphate synthase pdxT subunit